MWLYPEFRYTIGIIYQKPAHKKAATLSPKQDKSAALKNTFNTYSEEYALLPLVISKASM
jgi:hypothetical protein